MGKFKLHHHDKIYFTGKRISSISLSSASRKLIQTVYIFGSYYIMTSINLSRPAIQGIIIILRSGNG